MTTATQTLKRFSAACLALAPVVLAVATAVDPEVGDNTGTGAYRDHPGAGQAHALLLHWAMLLFVPGLAGLLMAVRRRGGIPARIAWLGVTLGLVGFSGLMGSDVMMLAVQQHVGNDQVDQVGEAFFAQTAAIVGWQLPSVLGFALSFVFTPIALARAGLIRWWTAAVAIPGAVLYIMLTEIPGVNLIGPALLTVAYWTAAARLLRRPEEAGVEVDSFGRFRYRFGIGALVAAPLLLVAGFVTRPDGPGVDGLAAQPTATQASALLLHLAWLALVPAAWAVAERGGRWSGIAGSVTIVGLVNLSALTLRDFVFLAAHQALGSETANAIEATFQGYPTIRFGWVLPGMVLGIAGLAFLAFAAWRETSRRRATAAVAA
jgi:hypothetical protein